MERQCSSILPRFLLNGKCNITELRTGLIPLHRKYEEKKKRQKTPKKEADAKIDSLEILKVNSQKQLLGNVLPAKVSSHNAKADSLEGI